MQSQPTPRICSEPDCDRPVYARGMCRRHYRKTGRCQDCGVPVLAKAARCFPCSLLMRPVTYRSPEPEYVIEDRGHSTPCWIWQRNLTTLGYGLHIWAGTRRLAHRVVFEATRGPIPEGLQLDHLCRNPSCVNPDHLEPVTNAENQRRGKGTKLTADDVRAIRSMAGTMTHRELGKRFGVSGCHVTGIIGRKSWRDL